MYLETSTREKKNISREMVKRLEKFTWIVKEKDLEKIQTSLQTIGDLSHNCQCGIQLDVT